MDLKRSGYQKTLSELKMPNPGDVFLLVAFGWAMVCFLLVVGGPRIARQLALFSGSSQLRDLLLAEQSAVGLLMIAGILGLAAAFYLFNRYRDITIATLFIAMAFSDSWWPPLHNVAFALKYLILIYLGAYSAIFFIKNGWRLVSTQGYRLVVFYLAWLAFVVIINGFKFADIWYLSTEFTLMIGFGIVWLSLAGDTQRLLTVNRVIAYSGVIVCLFHMLAVVVVPNYIINGRFVGMSVRATGFSTIFAIFVVAMFWMSMYEKNVILQRLFNIFAFIGFGLILWSGTRNATVAALLGIIALWWVIRSRLLVYIVAAGFVGLLMQIILTNTDEVSMLSDRLASTENTRLEAWKLYFGLFLQSPVYGYGFDGMGSAVFGEKLVGIVASYARVKIPGVHNLYLGMAVRFGVVGMLLELLIFFVPARIAYNVIFSNKVSLEDKKAYILPVALLMVVMLEGLFEDTMGSTGKGTVHNMIFGLAIPIVYMQGKYLLTATQTGPADTPRVLNEYSTRMQPLRGGQ